MYHLHRALNAGRIDLERFLRVRSPFNVRHVLASSDVALSRASYLLRPLLCTPVVHLGVSIPRNTPYFLGSDPVPGVHMLWKSTLCSPDAALSSTYQPPDQLSNYPHRQTYYHNYYHCSVCSGGRPNESTLGREQTTRVLAEEQFMKRALIEKILAGIPMGESALALGVQPDWS